MQASTARRSYAATLIAIVALTIVAVTPAAAVTDGEPDGNGHPFVGLMVAQDAKGNPLWRCSGTLLSSTVFLTAGHCTEAPAARAEIWFDADVTDAAAHNYPFNGDADGKVVTHPDYDPNAFYLRDLGLVLLNKPVRMSTYGKLPGLDSLDKLATKRGSQDVTFTAVGYGQQKAFPDAAAWKEASARIRMVAYPKLDQINTAWVGDFSMLLSNNANTGGTCFGDSGGPNFLGTSNVVAGVTSYGQNDTCAGTGGVFRMDRSWSLDFVSDYLN